MRSTKDAISEKERQLKNLLYLGLALVIELITWAPIYLYCGPVGLNRIFLGDKSATGRQIQELQQGGRGDPRGWRIVMANMRVQELSEKRDGFPSECFIQKESNRPGLDLPISTIPVIDISRLLDSNDSEEKAEEESKLKSALNTWGLFQAVGHGIPNRLLDEIQVISKSFFHQPMEEKMKYFTTELEGYGNDKIQYEGQILDWMDRLYLQVEPKDARKMTLWPEVPTSFRETLDEYSTQLRTKVDDVLKAIARLLGLEESYFTDQRRDNGTAFVRFNYFPRCSRPDLVNGLKPHTDVTEISIIFPDQNVRGLQVYNDELGWVEVPILPYAFVINIGDQMQILSNGQCKSPLHRVTTNSEKERFSLAMFIYADFDKDLEPANGLIGEGRPRLYKTVNGMEYFDAFVKDFYKGGVRTIDSFKI